MHTNLLILAAGASSRMKQSLAVEGLSEAEVRDANSLSKALISFGNENRPVLDFLLMNAEKAGYKEVYLIVGEQSDAFRKYYGSNTRNNEFRTLRISYATQVILRGRKKPLGTADAVTQAQEQFPHLQNQTFTVCNSDNLYSVEALRALRATSSPSAFIAYDRDGLDFTTDRISRFALVRMDAQNILVDIIEKPSEENLENYKDTKGKLRVSMNLFKFDGAALFPYLKNCPLHPIRDEKELPTAILNYSNEHPGEFMGIPFKEHVPDLTSKEDIVIFKRYLDAKE